MCNPFYDELKKKISNIGIILSHEHEKLDTDIRLFKNHLTKLAVCMNCHSGASQ